MGSAGNLRAHQSILCMEYAGVYLFQRFPSQIIVAVSRSSRKVDIAQPVLLHGGNYLELVKLRILVDRPEPLS